MPGPGGTAWLQPRLPPTSRDAVPGRRDPDGDSSRVLVVLALVVSRYWRERATLPLGVHPLAVGHPPGSGLGPAGEGGAHHRLNDLRPRGQVC